MKKRLEIFKKNNIGQIYLDVEALINGLIVMAAVAIVSVGFIMLARWLGVE